jgi:putative peptidoglycan lipid II flippase
LTVKGQILKSASVIAFVTVISRICGYLRDQRVALLLGTSPAADAFILAFRIPTLIRRMTGEGALGSSFIPVFSGLLQRGSPKAANSFAQRTFWSLAIILAVVAALGFVFSKQVILIYTIFGGTHVQWNLAILLNRIIFPCVFFIGLAALASAFLNTFQVFALPASTSIFFNLAMILCSLGFIYRPILRWTPEAYRTPAVALAVGVLIGAALQLFVQIPALLRRGVTFRPQVSFSDPAVRKVGRLMGPAFFGMGVYQINMFVDTIFGTSSRMPSGSISSLYIADRVMQLVLGSYAIAMSTALLPMMSHQAASGKFDEMKHAFGFSLRIVSFITIPAAVGLILLRRPIIQVLFQHGQFSVDSTLLTSNALFYYSMGLPAYAAIKLITTTYYSTQDTMTPARIGAYAVGMNIALNAFFLIFFYRYLSNGSPALASSLAAYFNFALLLFVFRKRFGNLEAHGLGASFTKTTLCTGAMAAVSYEGFRHSSFQSMQHFLPQAGVLAGLILASTAAYFGVAWLLRCEELSEFLLLLRRGDRDVLAAGLQS